MSQTICGSSGLYFLYNLYTPSFCGRMGGWDKRILKAGRLAWCTNSTRDPVSNKLEDDGALGLKRQSVSAAPPCGGSQYSPVGGFDLLREVHSWPTAQGWSSLWLASCSPKGVL